MKKSKSSAYFLLPFLIVSFATAALGAEAYKCDVPGLSAVKFKHCKDTVFWGYDLDDVQKNNPAEFERRVQEQVTKATNAGSAQFKWKDGTQKNIYRGSFIADAPLCIQDLVKDGGVRSVMNLYNMGDLKSHDALAVREKALFQKEGAGTYVNILNYTHKFKDQKKEQIFDKLAEIISTVKALPGNVFLHCYGGMHRTGLVFGVMQKCLNKIPLDQVIGEYRCHVAYESETRQGGRHAENEEVLRDFPCEKLTSQ